MAVKLLFILFMAILLIVMVITLLIVLRPRRRQAGFPVILPPGERSAPFTPPAPDAAPKP